MDDVYVVKFGGNAILSGDDMKRLCGDISDLVKEGAKVVLVHGGGPQISEEMERCGLEPVKVHGFRVTDRPVLDVAERVLRGLNSQVVSCLRRFGIMALGVAGYRCSVSLRKGPVEVLEDGVIRKADLGMVGDVAWCDVPFLEDLLEVSVTPVVYPIGRDAEGRALNINADSMAAGIASHMGCREMVTITDVPGILTDLDDPGSKLDAVSLDELDSMIADGTVSGGMIPKVEACRRAILAGVPRVRMVDGTDPECIVSDVMRNDSRGTVITR